MGLGTLLFVIFLVLKLTHEIDWSWFLVVVPLIAEFVISVLVFGVIGRFIRNTYRNSF